MLTRFARKVGVLPALDLKIDPGLIQDGLDRTKFTPDLWYLQQFVGQLLFVADEMMSDRRYHHKLPTQEAMRVCSAYTKERLIMLNKELGKASWPAILPASKHIAGPIGRAQPAHVKGELYFVRATYIPELDKYKENGTIHTRQRVTLDIPFREQTDRTHLISWKNGATTVQKTVFEPVLGEWKHGKAHAWMYVGIPEHFFWDNYAESRFAPAKLIVPQDRNLRPYYFFK